MRRDGPEGPELPHRRRQPEKEEPAAPWPTTPGELILCILLFILFFAFSWGLVLWDEVFINTSDAAAADTVHAVFTGAGRMAVSSAVLAVTAVYTGKKASPSRRNSSPDAGPGPEATLRKHGEDLDSLKIHVACHRSRNNRLDDQLAEPSFPDIDDHVMSPSGKRRRGPEHLGGPAGC